MPNTLIDLHSLPKGCGSRCIRQRLPPGERPPHPLSGGLCTPPLFLPRIGDLHHLLFFIALVGNVHFKQMGIVIHDFRHGTPLHRASDRIVVETMLGKALAVRSGRSLEIENPGTHGVHPG